jgi:ribosome-binding protein aMBF1 (putative translation factor)
MEKIPMMLRLTSKRRPERLARGQTGKGTPITEPHAKFVQTMLKKMAKAGVSARSLSQRMCRSHAYVAKVANLEVRPARDDAKIIMEILQFSQRDQSYFTRHYLPALRKTQFKVPATLSVN